ncbi:phosphatidylinositol 4-phosphate 5-kinase 7-like [Chenopodium quinoa]|uniref:phosphatidylinositol 4-phosphate 5-kinase 7-like n=1 Tax=Chenopodium quinoa TaxID=63459 RepID=UPI000B799C03|nr:phosphatidylinositol 4-phosphate 5-kinase 7-like [Chenopodium quinoa]
MENTESHRVKVFPNGDVYNGDNFGTVPHGKGKYTWYDGTTYEGDWEEGKMTGKGRISWPSGSIYEGEFSGGYLHGQGALKATDGSTYDGAWRMNTKDGFGKKNYANSDFYEGSWKEGLRQGSGKYMWSSGNAYIGTWKSGMMCGKGLLKWANGDIFYGSWLDGLRDGSGFYRFSDGGCYCGTWSRGIKDGKGTFYPAGSKHVSLKKWFKSAGYHGSLRGELSHSTSLGFEENNKTSGPRINRSASERISSSKSRKSSSRNSSRASFERDFILGDIPTDLSSKDSSCQLNSKSSDDQYDEQEERDVVFEREYMQGVLLRERLRKNDGKSFKVKRSKYNPKKSKSRSCITISSGNQSHYFMLNLQLGIRYTVGKITPIPAREVRYTDFAEQARIKMFFPRKGSQLTPPHYSLDFYWKDYCPMVFRNLREMFKLNAADYMMSICGDDGLREISSPGKSGSLFYLSHDDRFVIKTLRKSELKVFLRMLPSYYSHVQMHENTLITKFFGLHRIKLKCGRKVRFVVMGNMFYTELRIHRRYDLKGSSYGRSTNKETMNQNSTLKDLDLKYEFYMDRSLRDALFEQIELDCRFLESQNIIDYSLLLGLHFRAPEHLKSFLELQEPSYDAENKPAADGMTSIAGLSVPPTGLMLVTHEPGSVNTAPGPHIRGSTLRAYSVGDKEVDLLLPGTGRLRVQLGVNMPALANRKVEENEVDSMEVELFEVYDVVLYLGMIDILQDYNLRKKIEHASKSLLIDPVSISVVEPKLYARRFIAFLEKVFPVL